MKKRNLKGLSLIEILIVVTIFAILGVMISESLILTIQGTKKSESLVRVRENVNYSLSVIERNIRNASSIVDCTTNTDASIIYYLDQTGSASSFSCVNSGNDNSYIASGSSRLTSDSIKIDSCVFTCSQPSSSNPPLVTVDLTVHDISSSGIQSSSVSTQYQIYLRN
jgi:prepilin-type N-terminal cleavage/methylation domain-containing protein